MKHRLRKRKRKKRKGAVRIKRLSASFAHLEAALLLQYGWLVRVIILLIAATAAGLVFIYQPQEVPSATRRSTIVDVKTLETLQDAMAKKSLEYSTAPHVQVGAFYTPPPTPRPTPTIPVAEELEEELPSES